MCDIASHLHSQVFLAKGTSRVVAISGDMRGPEAILGHHEVRGAGFDLREPACVILGCVLHFVDAETAGGIVGRLTGMLAPGSYLVISVGYGAGKAGDQLRQHLQCPGRLADLRPLLGADYGHIQWPGARAAGRRGRLPLAGGTAGHADRAVRHDRRRGGPGQALMSTTDHRPRTWPGRRPGPSRRR